MPVLATFIGQIEANRTAGVYSAVTSQRRIMSYNTCECYINITTTVGSKLLSKQVIF